MIYGIAGKAGTGKTTIGRYLANELGCSLVEFSDPLKDMLKAGFGLTDEILNKDKATIEPISGVSYRRLLQTLGTEWGRDLIDKNLWVKLTDDRLKGFQEAVICGVRFENEAAYVRQRGKLIHVHRASEDVESHSSEDGVDILSDDIVIDNTGELRDSLRQLAEALNL